MPVNKTSLLKFRYRAMEAGVWAIVGFYALVQAVLTIGYALFDDPFFLFTFVVIIPLGVFSLAMYKRAVRDLDEQEQNLLNETNT